MSKLKLIAAASFLIAGAAPAYSQTLLDQIYGLLTPGVVGNVVQVGVGDTRIGSTSGLSGGNGTPTTVIGASVDGGAHPPCGSAATVQLLNNGQLASGSCP